MMFATPSEMVSAQWQVDTWLEVVPQVCHRVFLHETSSELCPQIIAWIQTPSVNVRRLINTLLIDDRHRKSASASAYLSPDGRIGLIQRLP